MKHILNIIFFIFAIQGLIAQDINKDSIRIKVRDCNKAKSKISIVLENRTGKELIRLNPVAPLQLFKWNGQTWEQVSQIGYCSCGIVQCPPPPEFVPFYANDVLAFEWDQMKSFCTDMEKGTKDYKWAGRGKYKVVFEFRKERYGESFQVEKTFKIR